MTRRSISKLLIALLVFSGVLVVNNSNALAVSNATLNGQYMYIDQNTDGTGERALITFDGKGNGTFQILQSTDSSADTSATDQFSYVVSSDGTFAVDYSGRTLGGVVDSDGMMGIASDFSNGNAAFEIFVKKSTGMTNASINGQYLYIDQNTDGTEERALLTFDGNGNGTFQLLASTDSSADTSTTDQFTYTVDSDGTFTVDYSGGTIQGIVRSDGNLCIASDFSNGNAAIEVFVKKSTGMSAASLNGKYIYVDQSTDGIGERALITFDGNGNGTFQILESNAADADTSLVDQFTYTVDSDGTLAVDYANGTVNGIVDPNGRVGLASDIKDGNATIEMFVKESSSSSSSSCIISTVAHTMPAFSQFR